MNIGAGFRAAGEGLQLIATQAARRDELNWQALRLEHLEGLRQKNNLALEGERAKNEGAQRDKKMTWRSSESKAAREADDARQNRADGRADARQSRAERSASSRELAEARRHRVTTLQAFRQQYSKALTDFNSAKAWVTQALGCAAGLLR